MEKNLHPSKARRKEDYKYKFRGKSCWKFWTKRWKKTEKKVQRKKERPVFGTLYLTEPQGSWVLIANGDEAGARRWLLRRSLIVRKPLNPSLVPIGLFQ